MVQGAEQFVYVALGDSYQAGEGAGNSITGTAEYLDLAYENGTNFPLRVGPQTTPRHAHSAVVRASN